MQTTPLLVFGLAMLAFTFTRRRAQGLRGWQRLFGLIAVIATFLILLQPEFLALGLFEDTAFFDMLALALSLQMHWYVTHAIRFLFAVLSKTLLWLGIPSPGFSFLLAVVTVGSVTAVSALQRGAKRISRRQSNEVGSPLKLARRRTELGSGECASVCCAARES